MNLISHRIQEVGPGNPGVSLHSTSTLSRLVAGPEVTRHRYFESFSGGFFCGAPTGMLFAGRESR